MAKLKYFILTNNVSLALMKAYSFNPFYYLTDMTQIDLKRTLVCSCVPVLLSSLRIFKNNQKGLWHTCKVSLGQIFQCYFILLSLQNDSILSYDLSYLLRGGVPYHGQFQKSYQRRIEYGGTGKTTTKQNTINNSWMSLGRPVFGSGLLFCSASLENSQIPR